MEKEEVAIGNPVTVAGITVIPVAKTLLNYRHGKRGVLLSGAKQPIGIVVISPSAKRAFRITGEEVPLDQLIQEAPDLRGIIETSLK